MLVMIVQNVDVGVRLQKRYSELSYPSTEFCMLRLHYLIQWGFLFCLLAFAMLDC